MISQLADQATIDSAAATLPPTQDPATPPVQARLPQGVPGANAIPTPGAGIGPTNMKGAVSQAVSANSAIQKAAGAQLNATPEYQKAAGAASQVAGFYERAAQENARRTGQMEALATAPEPDHIPVPRLKELPTAPVREHPDPLRAMGQFLPLLATFGALATAAPATNALNAATAAITATRNRDDKAADEAHAMWLDNLKLTLASNEQLTQEYQLALNDRSATMAERMARIQALAALNKDNIATAQLMSGSMEPFMNLLKTRQQAAEPLQHILDSTLEDQRQREVAADTSARGWVEESIRMLQAQAAAGQKAQVQPDDVAGQIFTKMITEGKTFDQLPAGDQATLKEIYKYRAAGAQTSGLASLVSGAAPTAPAPAVAPAAKPEVVERPTAGAATAVPTTQVGGETVYLPTSAADMVNIPTGAKFKNPSDGRVLPKAR